MFAHASHAQGTAPIAASPPSTAAPPSAPASAAATLAPVVVSGKAPAVASVAGFGDAPLSTAPLQATTLDARRLRDNGATRLADVVRFDAAVTEAYDTAGYIDYLTVRGFVIDNRFNFRRDGLPIGAETSIPLENKARVDVLKGTSGIQVGTSAPGGLVDLVVKRPLDAPFSSAFLEWREKGSVVGAVDLSRRFGGSGAGGDAAFGLRLNAAAERIDPEVRDARGHRNVIALAGDWRATGSTLVEAEAERSHRSQPSVPGFSLLGDRVPEVPNPRLSLNNQPWSQPVVFDATTASLRLTQRFGDDWRVVAHGVTQKLVSDDRIAFPFGCTAADDTYYADRYCPDGTFDLYDFRSLDERRSSRALDVTVHGRAATGALEHRLGFGVQRSLVRTHYQPGGFNFAGTGNVDGSAIVPAAPPDSSNAFPQGADRDEASTEIHLRDRIALGEMASLWLGARHTRLSRAGVGSQSFTSPFAAATYTVAPGQIVYASWGRGVESSVAPALPRYANAGEAAPASRSRQVELGWKGELDAIDWNAALFDIRRPLFGDIGACAGTDGDCTFGLDGTQRHRGIDAGAGLRAGPWHLRASVQWLKARVDGRRDDTLDDKRPTNVPALTARAFVDYAVGAVPGLVLQAAGSHESRRDVLPDNSIRIPSVTRVDIAARVERHIAGVAWTLRAGIDNLFDRRAWRESPYQFGHAYLFPQAPRTARISLQADL